MNFIVAKMPKLEVGVLHCPLKNHDGTISCACLDHVPNRLKNRDHHATRVNFCGLSDEILGMAYSGSVSGFITMLKIKALFQPERTRELLTAANAFRLNRNLPPLPPANPPSISHVQFLEIFNQTVDLWRGSAHQDASPRIEGQAISLFLNHCPGNNADSLLATEDGSIFNYLTDLTTLCLKYRCVCNFNKLGAFNHANVPTFTVPLIDGFAKIEALGVPLADCPNCLRHVGEARIGVRCKTLMFRILASDDNCDLLRDAPNILKLKDFDTNNFVVRKDP